MLASRLTCWSSPSVGLLVAGFAARTCGDSRYGPLPGLGPCGVSGFLRRHSGKEGTMKNRPVVSCVLARTLRGCSIRAVIIIVWQRQPANGSLAQFDFPPEDRPPHRHSS